MSASSMHWLKVSVRVFLLFAITVVSASMAFAQAQSDAADLRGYVRDQQGAVVTGATVTARNHATNSTHTATTNDEGFYQIVNLTPGDYDLTIAASTFKSTAPPRAPL